MFSSSFWVWLATPDSAPFPIILNLVHPPNFICFSYWSINFLIKPIPVTNLHSDKWIIPQHHPLSWGLVLNNNNNKKGRTRAKYHILLSLFHDHGYNVTNYIKLLQPWLPHRYDLNPWIASQNELLLAECFTTFTRQIASALLTSPLTGSLVFKCMILKTYHIQTTTNGHFLVLWLNSYEAWLLEHKIPWLYPVASPTYLHPLIMSYDT